MLKMGLWRARPGPIGPKALVGRAQGLFWKTIGKYFFFAEKHQYV